MLIRTPLVFADLRNFVIRNPPLVFGQNYLRKHNICQKFSRLRREIIYENTTFAKILENKGGVLITGGFLINISTDSFPSIAARNYMLNVKLRIGEGEASFEIVGEVQITTVDYLQLKKVQHKLYDLDRILKGKNLQDAAVREEVHASILKNVCGISGTSLITGTRSKC